MEVVTQSLIQMYLPDVHLSTFEYFVHYQFIPDKIDVNTF